MGLIRDKLERRAGKFFHIGKSASLSLPCHLEVLLVAHLLKPLRLLLHFFPHPPPVLLELLPYLRVLHPRIERASRAAFLALFMATVATGTPSASGLWRGASQARSAWMSLRGLLSQGAWLWMPSCPEGGRHLQLRLLLPLSPFFCRFGVLEHPLGGSVG